jgi:hypothetical protein
MSDEFIFDRMTSDLQAYLDHGGTHPGVGDDSYAAWKEKYEMLEKILPEGLVSRFHKAKKTWMCRDATATGEAQVEKSDSGKYELHITRHSTGKGTWNYSKGKVYREGTLIAEVCRNYGSFPFLFVEDHPNGNSYLVAGEEYQGQVVIELNTGRQRGLLPEEAKRGHGFCWASYTFHAESQLLVVDGCYWACPYQFKLFDFSDPMEKGWPEFQQEGGYIDADKKEPEIRGDTIRTFYSERDAEDYDEDENEKPEPEPTGFRAIKTWKREGLKLILQNEWVSDLEQKTRKDREEGEKRYEAWMADFKANDPLYLAYKARMKSDTWLKPSDYESYGQCYEGWIPETKEVEKGHHPERRWCRRINESRSKGYTLDFEWAVKTGPVKLVIYKDGNHLKDDKFFPHSVEGVNAAFDHARTLLGGGS